MDRTPHATRRLASRLASVMPPPLRRAAAGLWLDALSLPDRLADPARRAEPWQALHNVGGGDYALTGRALLQQLVEYVGLQADDTVLDIGCGTGRLAAPLAGFLSPCGGYLGFDVARRAIAACRRRVGRARPDFRFVEADVANREYRAGGRQTEAAYRFPIEDLSIDVAVATSVFSHMQIGSIRHYLAETRRTLRPGGRMMFTAYALTPERLAALERGEGLFRFAPWRDGAWVVDPTSPERAIAHPLASLEAAVRDAGLEPLAPVRFGQWLGPSDYGGGQDLFVAGRGA